MVTSPAFIIISFTPGYGQIYTRLWSCDKVMTMSVIASGKKVILRDRIPSDIDRYIYWQTHGEWRFYDAPFEGIFHSLTTEKEAELRELFMNTCSRELPVPRQTAIITNKDDRPLGWVNHYGEERTPDTWMVGISIAEDDALNGGLGTEALRLWVDYLFSNSTVHRIGLDTWSLNPRMTRVAEKLGFTHEGVEREVVEWEGEWLDLLHFGMLRDEWEQINRN